MQNCRLSARAEKEAELKKQFPRPEQHTQYLQALQNALEHSLPPPVLHEDLIEALAVNKPSASPQSLELYARWEAAHGAS